MGVPNGYDKLLVMDEAFSPGSTGSYNRAPGNRFLLDIEHRHDILGIACKFP